MALDTLVSAIAATTRQRPAVRTLWMVSATRIGRWHAVTRPVPRRGQLEAITLEVTATTARLQIPLQTTIPVSGIK